MKLVLLLMMLLLIFSVAVAQEIITPEMQLQLNGVGLIANVISGFVIAWVVKLFKDKYPKIKDAVTVVLASIISIVVLTVFDLVIGWGIWENGNLFLSLISALGINQTVSQFAWELFKKKAPVA